MNNDKALFILLVCVFFHLPVSIVCICPSLSVYVEDNVPIQWFSYSMFVCVVLLLWFVCVGVYIHVCFDTCIIIDFLRWEYSFSWVLFRILSREYFHEILYFVLVCKMSDEKGVQVSGGFYALWTSLDYLYIRDSCRL